MKLINFEDPRPFFSRKRHDGGLIPIYEAWRDYHYGDHSKTFHWTITWFRRSVNFEYNSPWDFERRS